MYVSDMSFSGWLNTARTEAQLSFGASLGSAGHS